MLEDQTVFIIDLNEIEGDDIVPVSMDYTLNSGAGVLDKRRAQPGVGSTVLVHSDDDDTLYYAHVVEIESGRDMKVRIDWNSCRPVINREWSAQHLDVWSSKETQTKGVSPISERQYG